ncbi:MAG TPA: hypothetical protein VIP53_09650 [Nitrososphaera sp.]
MKKEQFDRVQKEIEEEEEEELVAIAAAKEQGTRRTLQRGW